MAIAEIINRVMYVAAAAGVFQAFRYLDGRAKARKKFRKPKYKSYKLI